MLEIERTKEEAALLKPDPAIEFVAETKNKENTQPLANSMTNVARTNNTIKEESFSTVPELSHNGYKKTIKRASIKSTAKEKKISKKQYQSRQRLYQRAKQNLLKRKFPLKYEYGWVLDLG